MQTETTTENLYTMSRVITQINHNTVSFQPPPSSTT